MRLRWWMIAVTLVAAFLRFRLLAVDVRFHPDEALFASFARNAAVRGEWLLPGNLDKTPLSIYLQAVGMLLFGIKWDGAVWRLDPVQGEFAARMASAYASVLLVPVTYAAAGHITDKRRAVFAALLVTLSPYGIVFGATAFTDSPMVLFGMLSVWMALRGHSMWAGLWLMLGYASKQQAVFFLPLVVLLLFYRSQFRLSALSAFTLAVVIGWGALALWDAARPFPSILLLATQNNAPQQWLVPPNEVLPRLWAWLQLLGWMFGGFWGTLPLIITPLFVVYRRRGGLPGRPDVWAMMVFVIGYGLLHWLIQLNIYDRYVLLVISPCAILMAAWFPWRRIVVVIVVMLMLPGAWMASNAQVSIGGDKGEHDGIIELANYLNSREFGAIVYDRWLGWELNYYLGGWTDKRRAFYPTPEEMTSDPALYVPDVAPRYLPAPKTADASEWLAALEDAGFEYRIGYESDNFVVYVLTQSDGGR